MVRQLRVWLLLTILLWFGTAAHSNSIKIRVTNYQANKKQCGNNKGVTASGHKVRVGICAGDWEVYPPGTILKLDKKELLVVADTGNKVKGKYHIDRYNPYKRIYSVTSRGIIVHRGDRNWHRKANGAFLAVKKALQLRKILILKEKLENDRRNKCYSEWRRFNSTSKHISVCSQIQMGKGRYSSSTNCRAKKSW